MRASRGTSALQGATSINNIDNFNETVKPKKSTMFKNSRRGSVDFDPVGKAVDTLIDTFGKVGKKAYNAVKKAGSFGEWLKSMGDSVKNMTSEQINKLFNSAKSVETLNESFVKGTKKKLNTIVNEKTGVTAQKLQATYDEMTAEKTKLKYAQIFTRKAYQQGRADMKAELNKKYEDIEKQRKDLTNTWVKKLTIVQQSAIEKYLTQLSHFKNPSNS